MAVKSKKKVTVDQLMQQDILLTVEQNENEESKVNTDIEMAMNLLSFDRENYKVKKKLMMYQQLTKIADHIYLQKDHKYYGRTLCVLMFSKYIFLGNNVGFIRVLDIVRQTEVRPLCHESVRIKVHALFISEEGTYCVSGHDKGTLVLWDLSTYRLAHKMESIHRPENLVYCVRVWKETKNFIDILSAD